MADNITSFFDALAQVPLAYAKDQELKAKKAKAQAEIDKATEDAAQDEAAVRSMLDAIGESDNQELYNILLPVKASQRPGVLNEWQAKQKSGKERQFYLAHIPNADQAAPLDVLKSEYARQQKEDETDEKRFEDLISFHTMVSFKYPELAMEYFGGQSAEDWAAATKLNPSDAEKMYRDDITQINTSAAKSRSSLTPDQATQLSDLRTRVSYDAIQLESPLDALDYIEKQKPLFQSIYPKMSEGYFSSFVKNTTRKMLDGRVNSALLESGITNLDEVSLLSGEELTKFSNQVDNIFAEFSLAGVPISVILNQVVPPRRNPEYWMTMAEQAHTEEDKFKYENMAIKEMSAIPGFKFNHHKHNKMVMEIQKYFENNNGQ